MNERMVGGANYENIYRNGGALLERMISFAFPKRSDLMVDLYPSWYLPLFITSASLVLMLSRAFFYSNEATQMT